METQNAGVLFELQNLLTYWNVLLVVAVWTVVQTIRGMFPGWLSKGGKLASVVPALPIVICSAAVWIPGPWLTSDASWGERVVLGVVLGALTANGHSIVKKTGLHNFLPSFMKVADPKSEELGAFSPEPEGDQ